MGPQSQFAWDYISYLFSLIWDNMSYGAEAIQAFLTGDGHHSAATRRGRYSTLCAFYRWLIRHEIVRVNPMERLDPIEPVECEPRPLQPEIVTKIPQAMPASNLRDRTLFTLLYETGIWVGEALSLLAINVDLSTGHLRCLWWFTLNADFRPLHEYQGTRLLHVAQSSMSERAEADLTAMREEEELFDPIQLSLFVEEESDL